MIAATTSQGAKVQMRKILSLVAVLALSACGGGGGSSPQPPPPPTTSPVITPQGYVTPQFTLSIPARTSSAIGRQPQFVSSATLSVVITLTADSVGIDPTTISGNPATTVISPTCGAGTCTVIVNGPPTPPGTDSFRIVTYDNAAPGSGNALNAAQLNNVTITAGQSNAQSVTLGAIPKTLTISAPTWTAGTQSQTQSLTVTAKDGHNDTIPTAQAPNVFYVDALGAPINITVSDPDTTLHGSCVTAAGPSACTSGAATSVTFSGPDTTRAFNYDGLAENPVTLTASASGATSGTVQFQPVLNAPVFNSSQATPSGVALSSSAEIDLFALTGIGSTGSESFTESGWTNTPYNHALTFANTGACTTGAGITATAMTDIATITVGANSTLNGTPFTATVVASPKTGSCPSKISDGLSLNATDGSATLTVTYTTSVITGSSKNRQH
jgi:hypothetical protein